MEHQPQKLTLQLDKTAIDETNLGVLKRFDSSIEEILDTVSHVAIYILDTVDMTWSRKGVEGSLFVVKRCSYPRFQFIVMNKKSSENLVEDLLGDFMFEIQFPYILYRNELEEVHGIWFYHKKELERIADLFNRILKAFKNRSEVKDSRSDNFSESVSPLNEETSSESENKKKAIKAEKTNDLIRLFSAALVPNSSNNSKKLQLNSQTPSQPINISQTRHHGYQTDLPSGSTSLSASISPHKTSLLPPSYFKGQAKWPNGSPPPHPQPPGVPGVQPHVPPVPPSPLSSVTVTPTSLRSALLDLVQDDAFIELLYNRLKKMAV